MKEKVLSFHEGNFRSSFRTAEIKKDKITQGVPPESSIHFPSDLSRAVAYLESEKNIHTGTVTSNSGVWLCVCAFHYKQTVLK